MLKEKVYQKILLYLIVGIGIGLSVYQFIFNRSLWLDESYLALNIINRDFIGLLKPLDDHQVAPILFLEVSKLICSLFGYSEYSLRVLPLLSFWGGIYFFYRILKILFKKYFLVITVLTLFAINFFMVQYSNEFKQYMTDLFWMTCIFFLSIKQFEKDKIKFVWLGVIGTICIFSSNISPIILFSAGIYLVLEKKPISKNRVKYIAITFLTWGTMFFFYYILFIKNHPSRNFMVHFWNSAFLPNNIFSIKFFLFLLSKSTMYCLISFSKCSWEGYVIFNLLIILGIIQIILKKEKKVLLLISPILIHLILSYFKIYPFDLRLNLFHFPLIIILIGYGIEKFITFFKNQFLKLISKILIISLVSYTVMNTFLQMPYKKSEIKNCILFLEQYGHENDKVYMNYFSQYSIEYYKKTQQIDLSNFVLIKGDNFEYHREDYLSEIKLLKGRVWFVFSEHIGQELKDKSLLENYLYKNNISKKIDYNEKGASIFLIDFK